MIEEFMIHQPKRLKPLKVIVQRSLDLGNVVKLEEMLRNQSDLTSLLQFTFEQVILEKNGRDLVEEMMNANRINQKTHSIMHEYFATEEFHKIWM